MIHPTSSLLRFAALLFLSLQLLAVLSERDELSDATERPQPSFDHPGVEQAIERGLVWYLEHDDGADIGSALFLHYLSRKFSLPLDLSPIVERAIANTPEKLRPLRRLVDPNASVEAAQIDTVDRFAWPVFQGLYCDRFGSPKDYHDRIKTLSDMGGYELTHAVLGIDLALERGCLSVDEVTDLVAQQNQFLAEIPTQNAFEQDLSLEAIALLLHRDAHALIEFPWIEKVLEMQHSDGGWGSKEHSDAHATMLSLWILLEVAYPETADIFVAVPANEVPPEEAPPTPIDEPDGHSCSGCSCTIAR